MTKKMLFVSIGRGIRSGMEPPGPFGPLNPGLKSKGSVKTTSHINRCISTVGNVLSLLTEYNSESRTFVVFIFGKLDIQKYKKFKQGLY